MPEGQEVTTLQPKYFTKEKLDLAKVGVLEFQDICKRCEPQDKLFLKEAQGGKYLQAMFLGIKPSANMDSKDIKIAKDIPLPPRFRVINEVIYDVEQVRQAVKKNPDIFSDADKYGTDLDHYIDHVLNSKAPPGQEESEIIKTGILYGYPKPAAVEYSKYYPNYFREGLV